MHKTAPDDAAAQRMTNQGFEKTMSSAIDSFQDDPEQQMSAAKRKLPNVTVALVVTVLKVLALFFLITKGL
jgi:hypothetical protein